MPPPSSCGVGGGRWVGAKGSRWHTDVPGKDREGTSPEREDADPPGAVNKPSPDSLTVL